MCCRCVGSRSIKIGSCLAILSQWMTEGIDHENKLKRNSMQPEFTWKIQNKKSGWPRSARKPLARFGSCNYRPIYTLNLWYVTRTIFTRARTTYANKIGTLSQLGQKLSVDEVNRVVELIRFDTIALLGQQNISNLSRASPSSYNQEIISTGHPSW